MLQFRLYSLRLSHLYLQVKKALFIPLLVMCLWQTHSHANSPQNAKFQRGQEAYDNNDYRKAFQIWQPLAKIGHIQAQSEIGSLYEDGKGITQNDAKALEWYLKAGEQGSENAQNALFHIYYKGKAVVRNYKEAAKWLQKAAKQGNPQSQSLLAFRYWDGEGVIQSNIDAYMWFSISQANGNNRTDMLEILEEQLPYKELREAKAKAKQCYNSDYKNCD